MAGRYTGADLTKFARPAWVRMGLEPRRTDIRQQQAHIANKESQRRGLGTGQQFMRDAQHAAVGALLLPQEGQTLQE